MGFFFVFCTNSNAVQWNLNIVNYSVHIDVIHYALISVELRIGLRGQISLWNVE